MLKVGERQAVGSALRAAGVEVIPRRGKGGHWLARYGGRQAPLPMHGDRDMGPNFIKKICKELDLDPSRIL
jgi:predicted RNA binding protein YcfA (HicA-like mRNA interferase family)